MVFGFDSFTALHGVAGEGGWGWLAHETWLPLPAGLAMLFQPRFMDMPPIFLWCMPALPEFLCLLGLHVFVSAVPEDALRWTRKDILAPIRLAHALSLAWQFAMLIPREAG